MRILVLLVAVLVIVIFSSQTSFADVNTKSATILVVKHVINNDGGTAQASDFDITVDHSSDVSASPSSFSGSEEGTIVTLTGNFNQLAHFTVHETSTESNYQSHLSSNCSTYINAGESLVCVITNDDKPATSTSTAPSYAKADFDLSVTHPIVNLEQGSGTYSSSVLSIDSTIQIPSNVKVEVSVNPPGLGVTARDEGYSTVQYPGALQIHLLDGKYSLDDLLYVDVDQYTAPGTYLVNVKVSVDLGDGMITKTTTLTVNVTPPKTFSVSVSPNEVTVIQGGSANTSVTVTANEPHQYGLYLWAGNGADIHSGLKFAFPDLPNPISEGPYSHGAIGTPVSAVPGNPVTTTLTITASSNTPLGKHTIWVNAHGQVLVDEIAPDIFKNSNMYVPVTVNVVAPTSTQSSTTSSSSSNTGSSGSSSSGSSSTGTSTQSGGKTGLRVLKQVNNYGGGTKGPQDFTPDIDLIHGGSTYNNDHYGFPANGDMLITSGYNPGDRYQVHEELDPNYQVKYLDDCYGTIESGKVKTCIIVNTYIPSSSGSSPTSSTTQTTNSGQQNYLIPSWVRNNAKWWSQGQTSDSDFASGIGYLVTNKIIKADSRGTQGSTVVVPANMQIPSWIKNNANYWAHGNIDDSTFLQGIQYMLDNNIITFSTHNTAKTSPVTNSNQQLQKVIIYFVDDETNAPVNALVTIGGGVTYMEKETQRDGSIEVSLRPGSYTITADADNYQRSTSTFEVKDSGLTTTISLKKLSSASTTEQTPQNTSPSPSSLTPQVTQSTTAPIYPTIIGANAVTIGKSYSASITARAGMTYVWTLAGGSYTGLVDPTVSSITFIPSAIGTLTLSVTETNAAGDIATGSKTITVVPQPMSPTITIPATVTTGKSYTATVTPRSGMTYLWTIDDGSIAGSANTPSITFTAGTPGTLTLSVTETNAAGDSSAPGSNTVTVVPPPTSSTTVSPPTTQQTQLTVSISQTSASFTHNIGSSPCPTPIAMVTLVSSQQGSWQLTSAPSWISAALNGNQAMIGFNCQLQSYTTQTLNGDVTFIFTSLDGHTASTTISITGQIHGQ